ncbi:AraC family transcriptional regulator [Pedobacter duraquae]|uniref:AraC-like DNA-binding protein n=1 Tax=Pedobacter duraquae TaxID=425511 RepID=A0A4R6ID66_9SPHI|nr:AraC family transcriptional regulator [Pedobacter duraquae]TDO20220.1 AraC-like DNA-binding protein [Pedobacter duraquae]
MPHSHYITKNTNTLIAYWDTDLVCRFANNAYITWFGRTPDELIGKVTLRELLGAGFTVSLPYITGALAGKVQMFERSLVMYTGVVRLMQAAYFPDIKDGIVQGFYVYEADLKAASTDVEQPNLISRRTPIDDVESVLKENLFNKFPGISTLAKRCFISESKLKRDFKERHHKSVKNYYRHLQMQLGETYLAENRFSKKQLANLFNFSNPNNFSLCYRKYLEEKSSYPLAKKNIDAA